MAAAGHTDHLLGRVSRLVATCTRQVLRATRRLLRRRHRAAKEDQKRVAHFAGGEGSGAGGVGDDNKLQSGCEAALWSRRILMGERCQPLDFAGAIHYDSFGRRLALPPTPRSASSLSCRSSDSFAVSDAVSYLEDDV
ncbi:hypothetical protein ACP4OV_021342 [Aristida adscensionis]